MKSNPQDQARLLELLSLDRLTVRDRREIAALKSGAEIEKLAQAQRDASAAVLAHSNELDSVSLELKRAETDLELVEQRIRRDEQRLNQLSSAKDAQGVASEIEALKKRKSTLEDAELELLERRDAIRAELDVAQQSRDAIAAQLAELNSDALAKLNKLESGIALRATDRSRLAAQIEPELLALYERKASRGVPVGRLLGQECGACRIAITAAAFVELTSVASDEIVTCPECQAILVR